MNKKLVIVGVVLLLIIVGGGFFVWQNGKDVRELNKNLPEGVSVTKSLFGNNYRIVNKIDGYEFKVPQWWNGIKSIEVLPQESTNGGKGLIFENNTRDLAVVIRFPNSKGTKLEDWVEELNKTTDGLYNNLGKEQVGGFTVIKTTNEGLTTPLFYFFENEGAIYELRTVYKDDVSEIVSQGKW